MPDWYPHLTGDPNTDFALRTAFENLYTLRNQFNQAKATIPGPHPSYADIANNLSGSATNALNVTGLVGTLSQPQPAKIPSYGALPPASSAVDGELAWLGGIIYRFDAASGSWVAIGGAYRFGRRQERQNHVTFPHNDPAILPPGTPFFETDSGLSYIVLPDPFVFKNPNQWFFLGGQANMVHSNRDAPGAEWSGAKALWDYTDVDAKLILSDSPNPGGSPNGTMDYEVEITLEVDPTDPTTWVCDPYFNSGTYQLQGGTVPGPPAGSSVLLPFDKGYLCFVVNIGHTWKWTGTGWTWASGESSGYWVGGPVSPNPVGWWQQIPPAGASISVSSPAGTLTPITFGAYTPDPGPPIGYRWVRL